MLAVCVCLRNATQGWCVLVSDGLVGHGGKNNPPTDDDEEEVLLHPARSNLRCEPSIDARCAVLCCVVLRCVASRLAVRSEFRTR
jgi:hypothetical protein